MNVVVTVRYTPKEFDLVRAALISLAVDHKEIARDTTNAPSVRKAARETAAELERLIGGMHS